MSDKIKCPYNIVNLIIDGSRAAELPKACVNGEGEEYNSFFYVRDKVAHLGLGFCILCVKTDENGNEYVNYDYQHKENTYNLETKELVEELSDDDLKKCERRHIIQFSIQTILDNEYLMKTLEDFLPNTDKKEVCGIGNTYSSDSRPKLYKLCVHRQDLLEQLLKTSYSVLFNDGAFMALDLEEKTARKAVALPAAVMDSLVEKKRESMLPYFNVLCDDGNDAVILNDFINNLKTLTKRSRKVNDFVFSFLPKLAEAKEHDPSMTITEILRYVLHQTMYHNYWNITSFCETCSYFKDYTMMRMNWGGEERYPNNIFEAHDLMSRNTDGYTDEDKERFSKVSKTLLHLEKEVVINAGKPEEEKYSFIVPKTVEDLIHEGMSLHHCIGSWGKKIISGNARIVFMRKSDAIDTSLATLELDEKLHIVQAKIAYNEDLTPELEHITKLYERKLP